jgi:hypothetical protein
MRRKGKKKQEKKTEAKQISARKPKGTKDENIEI